MRLEKVLKEMQKRQLTHLIISDPSSIDYLINYKNNRSTSFSGLLGDYFFMYLMISRSSTNKIISNTNSVIHITPLFGSANRLISSATTP